MSDNKLSIKISIADRYYPLRIERGRECKSRMQRIIKGLRNLM